MRHTRFLLRIALMLGLITVIACKDNSRDIGADNPAAQEDGTAVLGLLSADTAGVLVVANLEALSADVATIASALGLDAPEAEDLLGTVRQLLGLSEGLRADGTLVVVLTDVQPLIDGTNQPIAVLVPVSDYAAFVEALGGEAGDIAELSVLGEMTAYSRQVGRFALVSLERDIVAEFEPAGDASLLSSLPGLGQAVLDKSDVSLVINTAAVAPIIRPVMSQSFEQMFAIYDQAGQDVTQMRSLLSLYAAAWDAILRDSTHLLWGLDGSEAGLGISAAAHFREGSLAARLIPGGGDASGLWAQLPEGPVALAMVFDMTGVDVTLLLDTFAEVAPETDGMLALMRRSFEVYRGMRSMATAWYANQGSETPDAAPGINAVTVIETADSAATLDRLAETMREINGLALPMAGVPTPEGDTLVGSAHYTTEYEASALDVDGARVDRYRVQTGMPEEVLATMGPARELFAAMGILDQNGYAAASTPTRVAIATNADEAFLRTVLAPTATLSQREDLASLRAQGLQSVAQAEMFIDAGVAVDWVLTHLPDAPDPSALAPLRDLPWIPTVVHIEAGSVGGRTFVPMAVLRALASLDGLTPPAP